MTDQPRGRRAERPKQIPSPGWLDVIWRVKQELADDRVNMLAAGIAFYALLSLFPAIAAVISLWALAYDPHEIVSQIDEISRFMPPGGASLINEQAREISESTDTGLSLTAIISLVVALFVASKGVRGVLIGLNVVYGEGERRPLLQRALIVAILTLGLILVSLAATIFVALFPLGIGMLGLDSTTVRVIGWLRWPVLLLLMMLIIAVLYRFGPYRSAPRWEWVSVGTVTATLLWLLGSGGSHSM
ncbi:ribonuclease [Halomonas sp. BC04]|nr:ribonuclease [Halomonas sp. BC04]